MTAHRPIVLVANARMPSQRAQSIQVAQAAAAFSRRGHATTLLYADRRDTRGPDVLSGNALWDYYGVAPGPRPVARAVACSDWIDSVPRKLQYVPARVQELTFARNAARVIKAEFDGALVLSREIETGHALRGRPGLFLEVHRVPGGRSRREWLLSTAASAAGVVAISGGVRDDLVALGIDPENIRVAHDGYAPQAAGDRSVAQDRSEAQRLARAELGLEPDRPVVVYTGGLLPWKGVDELVAAAARLPDVTVLIAGGMDADVARLRSLARDHANVRIDGFQPPTRVPLYLAAADLGVVPNRSRPEISAKYTSPLKLFEAMGAGLPLVVSDLPSLRDILADDEAVFVPPDDPEHLAQAIGELASDAPRRSALSQRMHARASGHTWDARAAEIVEWMEARL